MKRSFALAAGVAAALALSTPAFAQRIEITPFLGWQTSGSYPVLDTSGTVVNSTLRADAAKTYGVAFDYGLTQNVQLEFLWADSPTTYSVQSTPDGPFDTAFATHINHYQFGGVFLFRDADVRLRPFMAASLGWTHDSNDGAAADRSAFSAGVGGGVEYGVTRHVGFRGDARWMPTYGSSGLGTFCDTGGYGGYYDPYGYGGGCYQDVVRNFLQQFTLTVGLTIRP